MATPAAQSAAWQRGARAAVRRLCAATALRRTRAACRLGWCGGPNLSGSCLRGSGQRKTRSPLVSARRRPFSSRTQARKRSSNAAPLWCTRSERVHTQRGAHGAGRAIRVGHTPSPGAHNSHITLQQAQTTHSCGRGPLERRVLYLHPCLVLAEVYLRHLLSISTHVHALRARGGVERAARPCPGSPHESAARAAATARDGAATRVRVDSGAPPHDDGAGWLLAS